MINLKSLLLETVELRKIPLSLKLVKALQNSSYSVAMNSQTKLYRGMSKNPNQFLLIKCTPGSFRESTQYANYFNFFVKLLWKNFPDRTNCTIFSSDLGTAEDFGGQGRYIYPINNARIGVSQEDIVACINLKIDQNIHRVSQGDFDKIFSMFDISVDDYEEFKYDVENITKEHIAILRDKNKRLELDSTKNSFLKSSVSPTVAKHHFEQMLILLEQKGTLLDVMKEAFTPELCNCKVMTINQYLANPIKADEIWTSNNCIAESFNEKWQNLKDEDDEEDEDGDDYSSPDEEEMDDHDLENANGDW